MDANFQTVNNPWFILAVPVAGIILFWLYKVLAKGTMSAEKHIEEEIRRRLNKSEGELTEEDYKRVTTIGFYKAHITDLSTVARLVKVRELFLHNNQIEELSPLAKCKDLEKLTLSNNRIKDLSPLSTLAKLNTLSLNVNIITDLTPLATLTNLQVLQLSNNQFNDLTPLLGLSRLQALSVEDVKGLPQAEFDKITKALPSCKVYYKENG